MLALCGCTALIIWLGMVFYAARTVQEPDSPMQRTVSFGPLDLTTVAKQPQRIGYILSIRLDGGLGWYLMGWEVFGACWAYASHRLQMRNTSIRPQKPAVRRE